MSFGNALREGELESLVLGEVGPRIERVLSGGSNRRPIDKLAPTLKAEAEEPAREFLSSIGISSLLEEVIDKLIAEHNIEGL